MLTLNRGGITSYLAAAAKSEERLKEKSVLERLEIERLWWTVLGIPWRLVTERQISDQVASNLAWCSDPLRGSKQLELGDDREHLIAILKEKLNSGIYLWDALVDQLAEELELKPVLT